MTWKHPRLGTQNLGEPPPFLLDPDPLAVAPEPEVEPRRGREWPSSLAIFAGVLAIGAVAGAALGNDWRVSVGLWVSLVATFAVGRHVGRIEAAEWAGEAAEDWLEKAVETGRVVFREDRHV